MPFYSSSSLSFSNPGVGAEAPEFASLYEAFNPLTTVANQHFVEWFSGKALDSIWTERDNPGPSAFRGMDDVIDGGYRMRTNSTNNRFLQIDFNDIRHYEPTADVIISVIKSGQNTTSILAVGTVNTFGVVSHFMFAGQNTDFSTTDFVIRTADASSSETAATFALDTVFHNHKLTGGASNIIYDIDGVLEVTKTTNRPTLKQEPFFFIQNRTTAEKEASIRYYEAFNT